MSNEHFGSSNGGEKVSQGEVGFEQSQDFVAEPERAIEEPERFRMGANETPMEIAELEGVAEEVGVMPPEIVTEEVDERTERGNAEIIEEAEKEAKSAESPVEMFAALQKNRRDFQGNNGYFGGDD